MSQRRSRASDSALVSSAKRARKDNLTTSSGSYFYEHINSLPTDVLLLIFAYIPVKPRLSILSLVSKRWLSAVYRSLEHHRPPMRASLLRRLPHVTTIELTTAQVASQIPPDSFSYLKTIIISHPDEESCYCSFLQRLPSLTSVTLSVTNKCPPLHELLATCQSTLTDLSLKLPPSVTVSTGLQFPRLRSLRLSLSKSEQIPADFIGQQSSLEVLYVKGVGLSSHYISHTFPASLQRLVFSIVSATYDLVKFDVRTVVTGHITPISRFFTKLCYCGPDRELTISPGVRSLSFLPSVPTAEQQEILQVHGSRLHKLRIEGHKDDWSLGLHHCTALKKLTIRDAHMDASVRLRELSDFTWDLRMYPAKKAFVLLRRTLKVAPRLLRFAFCLHPKHYKEGDALLKFLVQAEAAGVQAVEVGAFGMEDSIREARQQCKWMRIGLRSFYAFDVMQKHLH